MRERRDGSGCRYRVMGEEEPGGNTALPFPFGAAPRPRPRFRVVRMEKSS